MGILDWFRPDPTLLSGPALGTAVVSPFAEPGNLSQITIADVVGMDLAETGAVTRQVAMRVPAIVKARALIAGTLSRFPLEKYKDGQLVKADPWMYRSDTGVDPVSRMLWTIDDLIFHGVSLWLISRGSKGEVLDAARVPFDQWEIDATGYVLIKGRRVPSDSAAVIPGPQEGLLKIGAATIRGALAIENAWIQRATAPVPLVELKITDQNMELTKAEKQELANDWERQRRAGGTAVMPYGLELKTHGETSTDLFVSGRNAIRLDIANQLNVPSNLLEGSYSTASLTYSTTETKRNELLDYSLSYWSAPIEARLSQDDIVPRGSAVQFNLDWLREPITKDSVHPVRKD